MKRMFLNIISCFLALFIFVGSFIFCVPSRVSAAVSSACFSPSGGSNWSTYISDDYKSKIILALNRLFDRCNLDPDDYYIFIGQVTSFNNIPYLANLCVFPKDGCTEQLKDFDSKSYNLLVYSSVWRVSASTVDLESYNSLSFSNNSGFYKQCILFNSDRGYGWGEIRDYGNGVIQSSPEFSSTFVFIDSLNPPFIPDYSLTGVIVGFDFSVEAFVQWLIDTEKYKELPSYIGTQKLKSFVQFYHDWGSSNSIFVIRLVEWLLHYNIASQTIENRYIIKSTIDRLYQDYKNSAFVQINHDSSILPHHRKNIETNTTDDDLTLVTDDPSDDTLISILRDILRGVISIPNSIYDNTQVIIAKLDQLNHNIIISNNGGASSSTDLNPVLNKMDDIIEALGSDTVSVEIDQTTKDDTDDFFDDWNLQFSTALNNKFPVASQLRTFFTGFFERCGIDADSDGEVFQYYNPGVLTASSVSRSAGTASEDDIVSDFLVQFDNSDPAFLDDASFHGVPDLSVSVGGHSVSIIDFRVYAKYREKIHFIISFVIWTLYLLHLYKALPSIIGQVADVATKTSEL